ncbi:ThiF family adenylyltransferase [Sphaerimonospora cavernae]|uniref:ThiF family adenylyltransferase n=1 Tax=Sphaerimonospora cavernae TaxID=1740611 RepID=A0ABV6UDH5_9ACTN
MRPRLKPVLRRVERDDRTLQFGVHPSHAIMLAEVEPAVRRLIDRLDGSRTLEQIVAESDLGEDATRELVGMLAAHGLIEDAAVPPGPLANLDRAERDRLRPELDRLALTSADGGMGALTRRRAARVRIYGAGRVGAQVTSLLAAAGVGHICVVDPGTARPQDVAPGGLGRQEIGMPREDGAVAVAMRIAPDVNAWPGRAASRPADRAPHPDLVVLAPVGPLDPLLVRELTAEGITHLPATAFEGHGSVGPLVVPGRPLCLGCLDLTRRDRDPSWPLVTARIGGHPPGEIACDGVLSSLVAAQAAGYALRYLDGADMAEDVTNGTLHVLPDGRWRRRSWEPHPDCGCSRNPISSLRMVA